MSEADEFLQRGWSVIADAVMDVAARDNLHLKPKTLSRAARSRCMGQFRVLFTLIQRLIMLMALEVELKPLRPRHKHVADLPDSTEDVTASFGPQSAPLRLAPARTPMTGAAFPDTRRLADPGPVSAAPVLARWAALHKLIKHPGRAAKRLARTLERWRAAKEPAPQINPAGPTYRFGAELGLVASLLPQRLAAALSNWPPPDIAPRPPGERVRPSGLTLL